MRGSNYCKTTSLDVDSLKDMTKKIDGLYHPKKRMRAPRSIAAVVKDPISTGHAAEILNISVAEVIRRARDKIYNPVTDHRGWYWFSRPELEGLMGISTDSPKVWHPRPKKKPSVTATKRHPSPPNGVDGSNDVPQNGVSLGPRRDLAFSGEVAKQVFGELEGGKNNIQIVMTTSIHPDIVECIEATWHRLKGCLHITRDVKIAIEQLPLQGELPIMDDAHLLRVLQKSIGMPIPCARCGNQKARLCVSCSAQPVTEET